MQRHPTRYWIKAFLRGVMLCLVCGAAAEESDCTRVLPEPSFPRKFIGTDSDFIHNFSMSSQSFISDDQVDLVSSSIVTLQTLQLDLDGDGHANEYLEVDGVWVYSRWWWMPSPRAIRRVAFPGAREAIWTQTLPPGLAGAMIVEDIDEDGKDDLRAAILSVEIFNFVYARGFQLLWSNGDGPLIAGPRSNSKLGFTRLEDVNADGIKDLLAQFTYYMGVSDRSFDEGIRYTPVAQNLLVDQPGLLLRVGDLNNDQLDDVVFVTSFEGVERVAISNGKGTFELHPLPIPTERPTRFELIDFDQDGNLDLWFQTPFSAQPPGFYIGYGNGNATFESYIFYELSQRPLTLHLADVNRDKHPELVFPSVGIAFMNERKLVEVVPTSIKVEAVMDVDGDQRDDLLALTNDHLNVLWYRSLGDGTFEEPLVISPLSFANRIRTIATTDFDSDSRADLLLYFSRTSNKPSHYLALRGNGDGSFEPIWEGETLRNREELLMDIDADGRPDLVSFKSATDLESDSVLATNIRRGNGLGFDPPMASTWLGFAGSLGRFRTNGVLDMVRLGTFGNSSTGDDQWREGVLQLELFPSNSYVLDDDQAPPTVDVRLVQLEGETGDSWRIATLPLDECSSAPKVVKSIIRILDLQDEYPISFQKSDIASVGIYEEPISGRRGVLLQGKNRKAMIGLFQKALSEGGFHFEHIKPMTLSVVKEYGEPIPGFPGVQLVQRFTFTGNQLTGAAVSRPDGDLFFSITVRDDVQSVVREFSFLSTLPH